MLHFIANSGSDSFGSDFAHDPHAFYSEPRDYYFFLFKHFILSLSFGRAKYSNLSIFTVFNGEICSLNKKVTGIPCDLCFPLLIAYQVSCRVRNKRFPSFS